MSNQSTKNDLYRVLRERLKAGDTVTPQSLANETGVSRATVYRFAKSLGYRDWSDCIAQLSSFYSKEAKKRAEQETVDYERLARLALGTVRRRIESDPGALRHLGAYSGWGGIVYAANNSVQGAKK